MQGQAPSAFHLAIPSRHNPQLLTLLEVLNADEEVHQLWRCANVNAVDRAGFSDHGPVHVQIVANAGVRMLRLLAAAGVEPSITRNYALESAEAEIVVVLACCLHDLGIAISRDEHEQHSLVFAYPIARRLLEGLYPEPIRTILVAEVLHCIVSHHWNATPLTIEAGVVKVADALDMSQGRSRIPYESGAMNIHSVSAQAIESVRIISGQARPITLDIVMTNAAGLFQVDELLKRKLQHSPLAPYVEVVASIRSAADQPPTEIYRL